MLYRKKLTVEAEQFDASETMIKKYKIDILSSKARYFKQLHIYLLPNNHGGTNHLQLGNWILTNSKGEHFVVEDSTFRKKYELVD